VIFLCNEDVTDTRQVLRYLYVQLISTGLPLCSMIIDINHITDKKTLQTYVKLSKSNKCQEVSVLAWCILMVQTIYLAVFNIIRAICRYINKDVLVSDCVSRSWDTVSTTIRINSAKWWASLGKQVKDPKLDHRVQVIWKYAWKKCIINFVLKKITTTTNIINPRVYNTSPWIF
jgi:hypothetical protein